MQWACRRCSANNEQDDASCWCCHDLRSESPQVDKYPRIAPVSRADLGVAPDPVNSPTHYRQYPVEVIEITEMLSFTLGNVVKYVLRADYKGKPLEDLKKAQWYLAREIARRERQST